MIPEFLYENLPNFFWSLAAFVCFVLILLKAAVKPVVAAIDSREQQIRDQLAETEQALAVAKEQQQAFAAKLKDAEQTVAGMLAEARKNAEQQQAQILDEGCSEAMRVLDRAKREIEIAKQQALVELRGGMAEVATLAAGRIIRRELDAAAHQQLVADAITELQDQS